MTLHPMPSEIAPRPAIDYPARGETIAHDGYTFRVSAPAGAKSVDLRLDEGAWIPCRPGAGFWWYDWKDYRDGPHSAVARYENGEHRVSCAPVHFLVGLPPEEIE